MFGIDFSEILVILGIALVVLGPERLPKLANTIGRWVGRARSMARQFRDQLDQEAGNVHRSFDINSELNSMRATMDGRTTSTAAGSAAGANAPKTANAAGVAPSPAPHANPVDAVHTAAPGGPMMAYPSEPSFEEQLASAHMSPPWSGASDAGAAAPAAAPPHGPHAASGIAAPSGAAAFNSQDPQRDLFWPSDGAS